MTRTEYDVVALGELLIDFTAQGAGADGYPLMAAHPGGAPANFLAAIARLGGRTALLSKVGADAFGTMLTGTLREVGVDTRGVVVAEDAFTTLAFVTLDARGERSFSFARKPGADTQLRFEELDRSLIEKTKAFHFGTLSLTDELRAARRSALSPLQRNAGSSSPSTPICARRSGEALTTRGSRCSGDLGRPTS